MIVIYKRLLLAVALIAIFVVVRRLRSNREAFPWPAISALVPVIGGGLVLGFLYVCYRHLMFPLQLECMELTVMQHAARFAAGQTVYPESSANFVALAYNPGYYFVLSPLFNLFGTSLAATRFPAILAALAICVVFFHQALRASGDWRWSLLLAGLPIVASRSFDLYLTKGHGDSLMVLAVVLAAIALDSSDAKARLRRNLTAAVLLGFAFWFKQHAAVVAIGAAGLMLYRDRRASFPALAVLILLGPVAYLFVAPRFLGPDFIETTFRVPSTWSNWSLEGGWRFFRFLADWWLVPVIVAVGAWLRAVRGKRLLADGILFLLPFVMATGLMGSLDSGSSDNVYVLTGIWLLLVLVRVCGPRLRLPGVGWRDAAAVSAVLATFTLMASIPTDWLPDSDYQEAFEDFTQYVEDLDGPIYAPGFGEFPFPVEATSRANWVALEDRVRGSGFEGQEFPFVREILEPVWRVQAPAYLLTTRKLERDGILSWLGQYYVLHEDVSDRFHALRELPCRWGSRSPRYVYRRITPEESEVGHGD